MEGLEINLILLCGQKLKYQLVGRGVGAAASNCGNLREPRKKRTFIMQIDPLGKRVATYADGLLVS